jgi:hypothetical protein
LTISKGQEMAFKPYSAIVLPLKLKASCPRL